MSDSSSSSQVQSHASIQARRRLDDAVRFLESGNIPEAQDAARELLGAHPEYVAALCVLGRSYVGEKNYESALPCFVRASMLAPEDAAALAGLANVQFNLDARELALETAQRALDLVRNGEANRELHLLLGRLLERECDYERACEHLTLAAETGAGEGEALLTLGDCYAEAGEPRMAAANFGKALEKVLSPLERAQGLYGLARLSDAKGAKAILADIEALEEEAPDLEDADARARFEALLAFAREAALERLGRHEEAWDALREANAPFDMAYSQSYWMLGDADQNTIERAAGWSFAGPPIGRMGEGAPLSLFILGPTRSGKSTLERLIGSIPGVTRGFENELIQAAATQTSTANGFLALTYPGQLPLTLHQEFTDTYRSRAIARVRGEKVLTTTHPGLAPDLGRIAETVDNARFVFVERDADDCAFRIFGKVYPENTNPFAYEVSRIYDHLEGYSKLADAWSASLGNICMRVSYDDMIADPKATLARVAEFCGLGEPAAKLPALHDDRGCAEPYKAWLEAAKS